MLRQGDGAPQLRAALMSHLQRLYFVKTEDEETQNYGALATFFSTKRLETFAKYFNDTYWTAVDMRARWMRWRWTDGEFRSAYALTSAKVRTHPGTE